MNSRPATNAVASARKLYEHGYRQGLSSRPAPQADTVLAVSQPVVAAPPAVRPLFPSRTRTAPEPEMETGEPEEGEIAEEEEPTACDLRVRGSISVAGLQKRSKPCSICRASISRW